MSVGVGWWETGGRGGGFGSVSFFEGTRFGFCVCVCVLILRENRKFWDHA